MDSYILEIIGIFGILCVQSYLFISTMNKINIFKTMFPDYSNFEIRKIGINRSFYEMNSKDIFSNLNELIAKSEPEEFEEDERLYFEMIVCKQESNKVTFKIIHSINTYLLKNRGVASDFHLIKDVVERNAEVSENDINQTISLPIYLGLLGTFLGIVIGLFEISNLDFTSNTSGLDSAISTLLGGVKIAMIASFAGLLLTIINTGYFFKNAKRIFEEKKNDFYTFIQTELLPHLNQNINSTLYSLQNNLHRFNDEFSLNIGKLNATMGKNHDTLLAQERILTVLDNMDITEFAKANIVVLKELKESTDKFSQFNQYLGQLNSMVDNSGKFIININEMISRTDNFNILGNKIIETFESNKQLQLFLQSHYDSLDKSHQLITNSVSRVNNTLDESLNLLKEFTQDKIIEVKKLVSKEIELLENQYPEKWKKLDNLTHLKTLDKSLTDIKMSSAMQMGSLVNEMKELKELLHLVNSEMIQLNIKNKSFSNKILTYFTNIWTSLKNTFTI